MLRTKIIKKTSLVKVLNMDIDVLNKHTNFQELQFYHKEYSAQLILWAIKSATSNKYHQLQPILSKLLMILHAFLEFVRVWRSIIWIAQDDSENHKYGCLNQYLIFLLRNFNTKQAS